jgi:hypothetical protein
MAAPETGVERAVFVAERARIPAAAEGYVRLYLGSEFCWQRLPDADAVPALVREAASRGMAFTLVTPLLDEEGLEATLRVVAALPAEAGVEVVANDVGLLQALAREQWAGTLVAGRLLTRQRRGPGFRRHGDPPPEAEAALRRSVVDAPAFVARLAERYGVRRFELDDLVQGVELEAPPPGISYSIYHPWLFVAVSRRCPWRFDGKRWRTRSECVAPCRGRVMELVPEEAGATLAVGGCAQYLRNEGTVVYAGPGVNRHVILPAVPA